MKNILYSLFLLMSVVLFSSCLKGGLEELPLYENADITSVSAVRYRYISNDKSPVTGEFIVKEADLNYTSEIDPKTGIVKINAVASAEFPVGERDNLSKSELVVVVSVSTAARLAPIGNSPKLGIPGDWTKENSYVVQAATGSKKNWTIEVVSLNK